jgi:hypothetical protein
MVICPTCNLNTWHKYTAAIEPSTNNTAEGWLEMGYLNYILEDRYENDISDYRDKIQARISANRTRGMRSIMDRPKTGYLAYGQRSDYQCEQEGHLAQSHQDYWFYTYNNSVHNQGLFITDIQDNSAHGSGEMVKQCLTIPSSPGSNAGYIVSGLKANHEQANDQYGYMKGDKECKWYVMPRIRIPTGLTNSTQVCRIEVLDWNGNTIVTEDLNAGNFKDNNGNYDGKYLQEFYFNPPNPPSAIPITEGQICPPPSKDFTNWTTSNIQTDFRVYWYGQCDMWIDYVRVENEPAHLLLKGLRDDWIRDEVSQLALYTSTNAGYVPNHFYQEEMEFNCIPCIGYINQIIQDEASQHGVELSLMTNINYELFKVHVPTCWTGYDMSSSQLKRFIVDSGYVKNIVATSYPLWGFPEENRKSYHPSTLSTQDYSKNDGILSYVTSSTDFYDEWLQNQFDGNVTSYDRLIKVLKLFDGVTKQSPNTRLINLHQNHLWWNNCDCANLKEPSNEELDVLANLALSYGAKGLLSFLYISSNDFTHPTEYYRGITEPCVGCIPNPRTTNVYDQNKWVKMGEINDRLKNKWGPTLMSFNNQDRHSYIYRLERNTCLNETYFHDIITYKPGSGLPANCYEDNPFPGQNPPQGLTYECYEDRYLQVATFRESSSEGGTYPYFMIVNRRCSPYIDESSENNRGGKRNVRVIFDAGHSELSGYNNWEIINVEDGSVVGSFNKTVLTLVDLDWFMPGEGKIYHLLPTAKVGGILEADEYITSGEEFTCEDTVWTNGYNLTIEDGVTIHFSDSAKFVVNGGTFQIGNPQHSGPNTINMDAASGNTWKGFEFNGANVKIYGVNFSGLANDSIAMLSMIDCPLIDLRTTHSVLEQAIINQQSIFLM